MNWLSLALQLLSLRQSFNQSRGALDGARAAAEKAAKAGVRAAMFAGFCIIAAVFVITGIITLVIEFGLQAERHELVRFSGLVGSSIAFFAIAALIVGVGALLTRESAEEAAPYIPPPPPPASPEEELRRVGAVILNRFLSRLGEGRRNR